MKIEEYMEEMTLTSRFLVGIRKIENYSKEELEKAIIKINKANYTQKEKDFLLNKIYDTKMLKLPKGSI
jgi:hypothetical protein